MVLHGHLFVLYSWKERKKPQTKLNVHLEELPCLRIEKYDQFYYTNFQLNMTKLACPDLLHARFGFM